MLSKSILVGLLAVQVHFAASYLVPLDGQSRAEFGGLLGWVWPWAYGDGGVLGQITPGRGFPISGFYLAVTGGGVLLLSGLAVVGLWVPPAWWRPLAVLGSLILLCLMTLFFGPTKLIPMAFALGTLYIALSPPTLVGTD